MHYWRPLHGLRMKGDEADPLERDLVQVVQGIMCRPGHRGAAPHAVAGQAVVASLGTAGSPG